MLDIIGLAQMKVLPDLPKFCLAWSAGPAFSDNSRIATGKDSNQPAQLQKLAIPCTNCFANNVSGNLEVHPIISQY